MKALATIKFHNQISSIVIENLDDSPGPLDLKARALKSVPLNGIHLLGLHNIVKVKLLPTKGT